MTRWEPSVLRGDRDGRRSRCWPGTSGVRPPGVRVLVLAATALLLADPFLLHQVGFLLSCGASLGIALLARPITARLRGPLWMREVLGVTAAAQVGVAPVLIPVFGSMPLVALPANLVAVPARRAAHDVGSASPASSAAWPGRCRPRSRACSSCRRSVCSTRSSRWPTSRRGCRSPSTAAPRGV